MKSLLENQVRKGRLPARLDLIQSLSGLALGIFMWTHLVLVSSILLGKDAMMWVTHLMEASFLKPGPGGGYPQIPALIAAAVFLLLIIHAVLAVRKFPANFAQYRSFRSHMKMMRHSDTSQWFLQALTGFILMFIASVHVYVMFTQADNIGPYASSDRFVSGLMWPLYLVLDQRTTGLDGAALTALRIGASLGVAGVSYLAVERPIRRRSLGAVETAWLGAGATAVLSLVLVLSTSTAPSSTAGDGAAPVASCDRLLVGDSVPEKLARAFRAEGEARGHVSRTLALPGCMQIEGDRLRFANGIRDLTPCQAFRKRWQQYVIDSNPRAVVLLDGWPGGGERRIHGV